MKKSASVLVLCFLLLSLVGPPVVHADTFSPTPPAPTAPDVIITSIAADSALKDAEIYNQTDTPVNLSGWRLAFTLSNCSVTGLLNIPVPSGWILPKHYLNFERGNVPASPTDYSTLFDFPDLSVFTGCKLASVQISKDGESVQSVAITSAVALPVQHKQRGNSPSSTRTATGDFATDYKNVSSPNFYGDVPYTLPENDSNLRILEVLPHARDCSPDDNISSDCTDYVKLYNPTNETIKLSHYRLRIGYKGQSPSVTNTFHFDQSLAPHKYFTLANRDDGQALSITDSGNFVWLEDSEGIQKYGSTVHYPDASSTAKVGHAWAYDGTAWRWTSAPHPFDANYFPAEIVAPPKSSEPTYAPCNASQYRSPETHCCRNIVVSASTLVPCKPT